MTAPRRVRVTGLAVLFTCLTLGLVGIGVGAIRGGAAAIGIAALVLAIWMLSLALRAARPR